MTYYPKSSAYAGYEEESVCYHGLSSTNGNSQSVMKQNNILFLRISYISEDIYLLFTI